MNNHQKILYLVRHAKSSWKDSSLDDRDRPLNKRGRRSAPDMGKRMLEQGHIPGLVISSPAKRARQTAGYIVAELGIEASEILIEERFYFAGIGRILNALEEIDDRYQKVMMVGHNPALTNFLNLLCSTDIVNMPTCAVAVIGFEMESWAELQMSDCELLGYDFPKGSGSFLE